MEYASTSEDEYGSNRHISKQGHTRLFPSTRVAQLGGSAPATPNPAGLATVKQHSREQDEYMRDWTAHSEEIARYVGEKYSCVYEWMNESDSSILTHFSRFRACASLLLLFLSLGSQFFLLDLILQLLFCFK